MDLARVATLFSRRRSSAGLASWLFCASLLSAAPAALLADNAPDALRALADGPLVRVAASDADGSASLELGPAGFIEEGGRLRWSASAPILLRDAATGRELARVERLSVGFGTGSVIQANLVVSNLSDLPIVVSLSPAPLAFAEIAGAVGRATTGFTVTDLNGDGATVVGQQPDGSAFATFYNDPGAPGSGSLFASLVPGASTVAPYSSNTAVERFPAGAGFSTTDQGGATLGAVSNMSAELRFELSAHDSASATAVYAIQPPDPPLTIALDARGAAGSTALALPAPDFRAAGEGSESGGALVWRNASPTILKDARTGAELARLEAGSTLALADQSIAVGLAATNNSAGPIVFSVTLGMPPFAPVVGAVGYASVALTLTDFDGGGASISGTNGDGQLFEAFYNDIGGVPATGASFATLVDGLSAGAYTTEVATAAFGAAGFTATDEDGTALGDVTSMSLRLNFSLGPLDTVSLTGVFALQGGGTVSGRVYLDADGNGTQDPGEPGLAGVDVTITDSQGGISTVTTDANGDYARAVPAGSTTLDIDEATLPAGAVQTEGTDPTVVDVPAGGSAADVDGYQVVTTTVLEVPALDTLGLALLTLALATVAARRIHGRRAKAREE